MKFCNVIVMAFVPSLRPSRTIATVIATVPAIWISFVIPLSKATVVGEIEKVYRWMQIIFYYLNESGGGFEFLLKSKDSPLSFPFGFLVKIAFILAFIKRHNLLTTFFLHLSLSVPRLPMNKLKRIAFLIFFAIQKILRSIGSIRKDTKRCRHRSVCAVVGVRSTVKKYDFDRVESTSAPTFDTFPPSLLIFWLKKFSYQFNSNGKW